MTDYKIILGNALDVLKTLEGESVQTCVTSPPYFGLRDYGTAIWEGGDPECDHKGEPMRTRAYVNQNCGTGADVKNAANHEIFKSICGKCGAVRQDEQLGLESTPAEFVARLVEIFLEVRRVLKKDGTIWLNLGDSYNGSPAGNKTPSGFSQTCPSRISGNGDQETVKTGRKLDTSLKPKDLIGIPWRVAFALQDAGFWLRQDIIWSKPNPMPESVTDRCTKAHEYIFLLSKSQNYFLITSQFENPTQTKRKRHGERVSAMDALTAMVRD
jgi:DNA methylase.